MISPCRLGHVLLAPSGRSVVVAWVEGGGQPIVRSWISLLEQAGEWALASGAKGVLVRRSGEAQPYWWGPGDSVPFNKAEVIPTTELGPSAGPGGWPADVAPVDRSTARYLAYWSDRAWWSLNPDATSRSRPLLDGEFEELVERAEVLSTENLDAILSAGVTGVTVSRYDMFLEEGLHLRGMIRQRELPQLDLVVTDPEDAVNPYFHAGPQKAQRPAEQEA